MTAHLLVRSAVPSPTGYRAGGVPWVPPGFVWPVCKTCGGPMQFIAQVPASLSGPMVAADPGRVVLVFQCQNQPGLCEEWEPESGGNAALVLPSSQLSPAVPPASVKLLPREDVLEARSYDDSRRGDGVAVGYCDALDAAPDDVVGRVGGSPLFRATKRHAARAAQE